MNWGIRFIHIVRRAVSRCRQRRTEPRQRRGPGGGWEADAKEQEKGSERKVGTCTVEIMRSRRRRLRHTAAAMKDDWLTRSTPREPVKLI